MVEQQGSNPRLVDDYTLLPSASRREIFRADRAGYVRGFAAELLGRATVQLGAGRDRVDDVVDPAVGAMVLVQRGQQVKVGDALLELHYSDATRLERARTLLRGACPIDDAPPMEDFWRNSSNPHI
jgi:pyrimidine-nucleoside phosphorylase